LYLNVDVHEKEQWTNLETRCHEYTIDWNENHENPKNTT